MSAVISKRPCNYCPTHHHSHTTLPGFALKHSHRQRTHRILKHTTEHSHRHSENSLDGTHNNEHKPKNRFENCRSSQISHTALRRYHQPIVYPLSFRLRYHQPIVSVFGLFFFEGDLNLNSIFHEFI